ncbi:hypothetical protein BDN72DRAFT_857905 [Pluteus cervinus]|uniref:Uncharacterized protein n=1 Tax=Pluteus cervinus TaxID=181527 RepID=A0ACD3ATU2_9AGAR|nr:hypothetical protein BDN72DRAFT_857905 [Pluteus cervinus]
MDSVNDKTEFKLTAPKPEERHSCAESVLSQALHRSRLWSPQFGPASKYKQGMSGIGVLYAGRKAIRPLSLLVHILLTWTQRMYMQSHADNAPHDPSFGANSSETYEKDLVSGGNNEQHWPYARSGLSNQSEQVGGGPADGNIPRRSSRKITLTEHAPEVFKRGVEARAKERVTNPAGSIPSLPPSPSGSSERFHSSEPQTLSLTTSNNDWESAWHQGLCPSLDPRAPPNNTGGTSSSCESLQDNPQQHPTSHNPLMHTEGDFTTFGTTPNPAQAIIIRQDQSQSVLTADSPAVIDNEHVLVPIHPTTTSPSPTDLDNQDGLTSIHPTTTSSSPTKRTLSAPPGAVSNLHKAVIARCADEVRRALDDAIRDAAGKYSFDDILSLVLREINPAIQKNMDNLWNLWQQYLPRNMKEELPLSLSKEEFAGLKADEPLSRSLVSKCYHSFILRHDNYAEILKCFGESKKCEPKEMTRGRRQQTTRTYVEKMEKMASEHHTKYNIETICLVVGSIVGEDVDLHGTVFTPHAVDFFKNHAQADVQTLVTKLQSHVYNQVALTQGPFGFGLPDNLKVADSPVSSKDTLQAAPTPFSGHSKDISPVLSTASLDESKHGKEPRSNGSEAEAEIEGRDVSLIAEYKSIGGSPVVQKMLEACAVLTTAGIAKAGIHLGSSKHFPWANLVKILKDHKVTVYNWPEDCPFPGKETKRDGQKKAKGFTGLTHEESAAIYGALKKAMDHKNLFVGVPQPPTSHVKQRVYSVQGVVEAIAPDPARLPHPTLEKPEPKKKKKPEPKKGKKNSQQVGGGLFPATIPHKRPYDEVQADTTESGDGYSEATPPGDLDSTPSHDQMEPNQEAALPIIEGSLTAGSPISGSCTQPSPPVITAESFPPEPTVDEPIADAAKNTSQLDRKPEQAFAEPEPKRPRLEAVDEASSQQPSRSPPHSGGSLPSRGYSQYPYLQQPGYHPPHQQPGYPPPPPGYHPPQPGYPPPQPGYPPPLQQPTYSPLSQQSAIHQLPAQQPAYSQNWLPPNPSYPSHSTYPGHVLPYYAPSTGWNYGVSYPNQPR